MGKKWKVKHLDPDRKIKTSFVTMTISVDMSKVQSLIDDLIIYSVIAKLSTWISCYLEVLDLPGDLFLIKQNKLEIEVLPSDELLKLHKEARRRYEAMD